MTGRYRVLLVDDELSIVKMVGKRLELDGYEVVTALDGEEGLAKVKERAPDLIVLDLMMPKLNGYEVCQLLKQDPRYQKIPIIIFTAKASERDEQSAMACGADAYVRKPFRAEELLGKARQLLGATPGRSASAP